MTSLADEKRAGVPALRLLTASAPFWEKKDIVAGQSLYSAKCAVCHGAEGAGGGGPALWGPGAFSGVSALAQPEKLAAYLATAMSAYAGSISHEEARDLAFFIDSHPRPAIIPKDSTPQPDRKGVP